MRPMTARLCPDAAQTAAIQLHVSAASKGRGWHRPCRASTPQFGEYLPIRKRKRKEIGPNLDLSKEEAVQIQLAALRNNDIPYPDAGVELLYRFADLDPFQRSSYFGWKLDLGQFTRFQRAFHVAPFRLLLGHRKAESLSSLQVSEREWRQRVLVTGITSEEAIFAITMRQRLGGMYDGVYYCKSWTAESPCAQGV